MANDIKEAFFSAGFQLFNTDSLDFSEGVVQNLIFVRNC